MALEEATYNGEPVDDLASEYWYNIAALVVLVYVSAFVTEFFMLYGVKKKWPKFSQVHISQFTQTSIPIPKEVHSKLDTAKEYLWIGLLIYRIIIFFFCVFTWWETLYHDTDGDWYAFSSFYTIWNFTMLICYFGCTILLTVLQMIGYDKPLIVYILGNFTTVIFNIEIALVFLVDSVVWIILLPVLIQQGRVDVILTFSSMIEHGMNLFFMLIDFTFNRVPIRIYNMTWMVVWALVYIFYAMLFYSVRYIWRYPFLNLWTPYAMFWYVLVFAMHFVFYMLCYGLYRLKIVIIRKYYLKNKHIEFDDFGAHNCPDLNPPQDSPEDEYLVNEY